MFSRRDHEDVFRAEQVLSPTPWRESRTGQHLELGIAENNLFLNLASLGLAHELFGARLLPVGTLYDPFIARGLDALNYACYQDARFILVATPSGITLAPEGGAHQSIGAPLIGISQPGLTSFEPAYADEVAVVLRWAFEHLQAADGGSVYLRLSTRQIASAAARDDAGAGSAGSRAAATGCCRPRRAPSSPSSVPARSRRRRSRRLAAVREDIPGAGLLQVTSADRLDMDWRRRGRQERRGRPAGAAGPDAALVTVLDGHPATLSWLGAVLGHRVRALGVDRFGQSADLVDLYRLHGLDAGGILDACAAAVLLILKPHSTERAGIISANTVPPCADQMAVAPSCPANSLTRLRADRLRPSGSHILSPCPRRRRGSRAVRFQGVSASEITISPRPLAREGMHEGVPQDLVDDQRQRDGCVERQVDGALRLDAAGDPLPEGVVGMAEVRAHVPHQHVGGESLWRRPADRADRRRGPWPGSAQGFPAEERLASMGTLRAWRARRPETT